MFKIYIFAIHTIIYLDNLWWHDNDWFCCQLTKQANRWRQDQRPKKYYFSSACEYLRKITVFIKGV
jgi:hypothetical protein